MGTPYLSLPPLSNSHYSLVIFLPRHPATKSPASPPLTRVSCCFKFYNPLFQCIVFLLELLKLAV